MYSSFEDLKKYLQWGVSLGDTLISVKTLKSEKKLNAQYPIQIERDTTTCLCAEGHNSLREQIRQFLRCFSGKYYTPDSIKKCCIRYFLTILQIIKEFNFTIYETIKEQEVLDEITAAKSVKELENALNSVLIFPSKQPEIKTGVIVKKVLRLVEEYYKSGITLKEVSNQLGLSPDYISSQFSRELGVNFSVYIKKLRVGKAKELLTGTNLKISEIAHRIGIDDEKYFSRVFREAEGIRPVEYRQKYR
jgi:two-component system response regulator YesN